MIISFDKFDKFEQPQLVLCNPACLYSNGGVTNAIGTIFNPTNIDMSFNFGTKSELSFTAFPILSGDDVLNQQIKTIFDSIEERRYIFIEDIGFFIITDVQKAYDNGGYFKEVTAESVEKELENRGIPYISDGTYRFKTNDGTGIMDLLEDSLGYWELRDVDEDLADIYRTFDDVDVSQNVYNFLVNEVQNAFECVFIFDAMNRKIDVVRRSNYNSDTDIHLTTLDWIKTSRESAEAENIYTALRVIGGDDDVGIAAVNPIGTNVIYDFSYYTSWMSDELASKVLEWQALVDSYSETYASYARYYYTLYGYKMDEIAEINRLNIVLSLYQQCVTNINTTQSTNSVSSFNVLIAAEGGATIEIQATIQDTISEIESLEDDVEIAIAQEEAALAGTEASMAPYYNYMESVRNEVSLNSYFTQAEYEELQFYIFEGNYTDSYVVITDNMTENQKVTQMISLIQRAKGILKNVCEPTREYEMNIESFPLIKEYDMWTQQLTTGCLIHAQTGEDELSELFLSNISVSYEDRKTEITFGNRLIRRDPKSLFRNALENITKSANSIIY